MKVTYIIIILALTSCSSSTNKTPEENKKNSTSREAIIDLLIEAHDNEQVEFLDIYTEPREILPDSTEKSEIVEHLKERDFKIINWARGNWTEGPRVISIELSNELCTCQVEKLYYSLDGYTSRYRVTEKIKCF